MFSVEERDRQLVEERLVEIETARGYPDADVEELDREETIYRDLYEKIVTRRERREELRSFLQGKEPLRVYRW